MILLSMFVLGLIIGFIGAGGAGIVIAVLTVFFNVPIHTALGTSLGAMIFTTMSGVTSHIREQNVMLKEGIVTGIFGAAGAYAGVHVASAIPESELSWMTAGILYLSTVFVLIRMFYPVRCGTKPITGSRFWVSSVLVGLVSGLLSGAFGIGAAPFVQVGLLFFFCMSIPHTAGTTMLILIPIALLGGLGYLLQGYMDMVLFAQVVTGLVAGAYIGAKFTKRLPLIVLKVAMVCLPLVAATLLLFGSRR